MQDSCFCNVVSRALCLMLQMFCMTVHVKNMQLPSHRWDWWIVFYMLTYITLVNVCLWSICVPCVTYFNLLKRNATISHPYTLHNIDSIFLYTVKCRVPPPNITPPTIYIKRKHCLYDLPHKRVWKKKQWRRKPYHI